MGYSEVPCHLCGVSFNISRIRRADEPKDASWVVYHGSDKFVSEHYRFTGACGANTGCQFTVRKFNQKGFRDEDDETEDEYDEENDSIYEDQSVEDDEPLEYESDEDKLEPQDVPMNDYEESEDEGLPPNEKLENPNLFKTGKKRPEVFIPIHENGGDCEDRCPGLGVKKRLGVGKGKDTLEHIAGPGCIDNRGYSGFEITVEEMMGCSTVQCLIRKGRNWSPADDDQDFELSSNYFLSGLSRYMPSRDSNWPRVTPARHGLEEIRADTVVWNPGEEHSVAMPFHPACFEIFKRASRQHFGCVDINSLMSWRGLESDYKSVWGFPRDPDVMSGSEQEWCHNLGSEYLAANPLAMTALGSIFASAINREQSFSPQNGAFTIFSSRTDTRPSSEDPFLRLPQEITDNIVECLDSSDIANLRLSSHAFRQLRISLWYNLLRNEMPWLWEIWSDEPLSFWATTSVPELKEEEKLRPLFENQLEIYRLTIRNDMPELLQEWQDAEPAFEDFTTTCQERYAIKASNTTILPRLNTNWYKLYRDITIHWGELKGLKNRRRIWKDIEEIIRRIKKYRSEGKIE